MKLKLGFNLVFITGLIMGVSAAAAQADFEVQPPEAYGIGLLGHPRDLVSLVSNNLFWHKLDAPTALHCISCFDGDWHFYRFVYSS